MDAGRGFGNVQHIGTSIKGSVMLTTFLVLKGELLKNLLISIYLWSVNCIDLNPIFSTFEAHFKGLLV